jgi:hypothetical protein
MPPAWHREIIKDPGNESLDWQYRAAHHGRGVEGVPGENYNAPAPGVLLMLATACKRLRARGAPTFMLEPLQAIERIAEHARGFPYHDQGLVVGAAGCMPIQRGIQSINPGPHVLYSMERQFPHLWRQAAQLVAETNGLDVRGEQKVNLVLARCFTDDIIDDHELLSDKNLRPPCRR